MAQSYVLSSKACSVHNCHSLELAEVNLELVPDVLGSKLVAWQLLHKSLSSACGQADSCGSMAGARC